MQRIASHMAHGFTKGLAETTNEIINEIEGRLGADSLSTFRRGRSVLEYGAVGGNAALDTAAFQAALSDADGTVFVPKPPNGSRYVINAPLIIPQAGTARSIVGLGNGMVEIEYTGSGYMIDSVSVDPADPTDSPIDIFIENIRIDGYNQTSADGAIRIDGAYFVNIERVEVRRFLKAGAIGIKLHNSFSIDVARSNVLSITNGIGIQVGGSLQQVTNFHLHDFILQRSGINLDISTGISGGGLQVDNGAIRANDAQIAVRVTGKYNNMKFGPALHVESETGVSSNTTKGFVFSGANLFTSQVIFDGIDFYNVKTLFTLDGSAGTLRGVTIDHIYATALPGLSGTAFNLTNIFFGFHVGSYHIASAEYTTLWAVTNVELADPIIFGSADAQTVIGTPSTSNIQRWPVWLLDSSTSEAVGVVLRPPRSWAAFAIDVVYTNAGAGSGNVSFRGDVISRASGSTLAAPTASSEVVSIAPAADGIKTVELQSSVPIVDDETVLINAIRLGASANDTLANDIGLVAIIVRRVA